MVVPVLAGIAVAVLVVLVAFALWRLVLIRYVPSPWSLRFGKLAQGLVSLLAMVACIVTASLLYQAANPPSVEELVCAGEASADASEYEGNPPHPITFVAIGDSTMIAVLGTDSLADEWSRQVPAAWRPGSPEEIQLVACLAEELVEIERCAYIGGSDVVRYRRDLSVRLAEAHTGNVISENTLRGSQPRQCRSTEQASLTQIHGDPVALSELLPWLEQYVEALR